MPFHERFNRTKSGGPICQACIHKFERKVLDGFSGQRPELIDQLRLFGLRKVRLCNPLSDEFLEGVLMELDRHYSQYSGQSAITGQEIHPARRNLWQCHRYVAVHAKFNRAIDEPVFVEIKHVRRISPFLLVTPIPSNLTNVE